MGLLFFLLLGLVRAVTFSKEREDGKLLVGVRVTLLLIARAMNRYEQAHRVHFFRPFRQS